MELNFEPWIETENTELWVPQQQKHWGLRSLFYCSIIESVYPSRFAANLQLETKVIFFLYEFPSFSGFVLFKHFCFVFQFFRVSPSFSVKFIRLSWGKGGIPCFRFHYFIYCSSFMCADSGLIVYECQQ